MANRARIILCRGHSVKSISVNETYTSRKYENVLRNGHSDFT